MAKIIVTGAAGFIGSKIVQGLNAAGVADVVAVDNLQQSDKVRNLAGLEIADYLDQAEFLQRLDSFGGAVEAVLHQGACSDTMESDGRYMMENNYAYSRELLRWCQEAGIEMATVYLLSTENLQRDADELASLLSGLQVKINAVALRGVNEDEFDDLIAWCGKEGFDLVFIEVMPMGEIGDAARLDQYLPLSMARARIQREFTGVFRENLPVSGLRLGYFRLKYRTRRSPAPTGRCA